MSVKSVTLWLKTNLTISAMARPGLHVARLSDQQVSDFKKRLRSKKANQIHRGRIQILLALDANHNAKELSCSVVGRKTGTSLSTVRMVVNDYAAGGVEEVLKIDRSPRSDVSRLKIDGRVEARILQTACGPAPEGRARWTLRLLEERCRVELDEPVSHSAIGRALKKTNFDLTKAPAGVSPKRMRRPCSCHGGCPGRI